jgi:hypothetical protein
MQIPWTISESVKFALVDGRYVLLDFNSGCYRVLNPSATACWSLLCGGDASEQAISETAVSLGIEVDTFEHECFAQQCAKLNLIASSDEVPSLAADRVDGLMVSRKRFSGGSLLGAWLALRRARRHTIGNEMRVTRAYYESLQVCDRPVPLKIALERFKLAEAFAPLPKAPDDCLPRSLALYDHLLASGIRAEHRIGVKSPPFVAHAWVETGGTALLDASASRYTLLSHMVPTE